MPEPTPEPERITAVYLKGGPFDGYTTTCKGKFWCAPKDPGAKTTAYYSDTGDKVICTGIEVRIFDYKGPVSPPLQEFNASRKLGDLDALRASQFQKDKWIW